MATGTRTDPYLSFNFLVEIDGITRASFQQVSGIESTIDIVEYREGGQNTTPRKLPGQTKYGNVTLRWGITDDMELYDWHKDAVQGTVERKNGSIVQLGRDGAEVARWNFVQAWPAKYTGPEFNAEGTDVAIETMELAHEGMERV